MGVGQERVWSWAASAEEADARRREASGLVGERLQVVRYYTLDYRRPELQPELVDGGPRIIATEIEWREPTWLFDGFDAMDYGIELETESGALFSLTWDPPGEREGIGLQRIPMLGSAVRSGCGCGHLGRQRTQPELAADGRHPNHLRRPALHTLGR